MKWLRRIISEEVTKVETRLAAERAELVSCISLHSKAVTNLVRADISAALKDFEQKVVAEASKVVAEKNKDIQRLEEALAAAHAAVRKVTHWKTDGETAAADHSLKVVK